MTKYMFIRVFKVSIFFLLSLISVSAFGSGRDKIYTSLKQALKNPTEVYVLDLRGQKLTHLPVEIGQLLNLEVLLLDNKLKNLWFCPKAWKYELGFKRLPAGGYAHVEGRGGGKFFKYNYLAELPEEICNLKNLKLIDIYHNLLNSKEWETKLKSCISDLIVVSNYFDDFKTFDEKFNERRIIFLEYGLKE